MVSHLIRNIISLAYPAIAVFKNITPTFINYNGNSTIDRLTTTTNRTVYTTWTNLTSGSTYQWYGFIDNTTGNYTTGIFTFTISQNALIDDPYLTILLLIVFGIMVFMAEYKNTIPWHLLTLTLAGIIITHLANMNLVVNTPEFYLLIIIIVLTIYYAIRIMFIIDERRKT